MADSKEKVPKPRTKRASDRINPQHAIDDVISYHKRATQDEIKKDTTDDYHSISTAVVDHFMQFGKNKKGKPTYGSHAHIGDENARLGLTSDLLKSMLRDTTYRAEVGGKTVDEMLKLYELEKKGEIDDDGKKKLANHEEDLEKHIIRVMGSYMSNGEDTSQFKYDDILKFFSKVDLYDAFHNEESENKELRAHLRGHIKGRHAKEQKYKASKARLITDLKHYAPTQKKLNEIVSRDGLEVKGELPAIYYVNELERLQNPNYRPVAGDIYQPIKKKK